MSRVCEDGQEHLTAETGVGLGARRSLSLVRLGAVQMPRWSLLESLQETEKVGRECRRVNKNAFVRKQTPALAFTYNSRHCVFPSVSVSGLPIPIVGGGTVGRISVCVCISRVSVPQPSSDTFHQGSPEGSESCARI